MFDLTTAPAAAARDLSGFSALVASLDDAAWERPVRLPGWRVGDLVRHVVGAATVHASGLRDAVAGRTVMAPLPSTLPATRAELTAAVDDAAAALAEAFADLPPDCYGAMVPVPVGVIPMGIALQMVPLEYAMHRHDLADVLGTDEPLAPDVAAMLVEILPGMLPMLGAGTGVRAAGETVAGSLVFELVGTSSRVLVASVDGGPWTVRQRSEGLPHSRIEGDDEALALFVMGRIRAADPRLDIGGDSEAAHAFKQYFPGP